MTPVLTRCICKAGRNAKSVMTSSARAAARRPAVTRQRKRRLPPADGSEEDGHDKQTITSLVPFFAALAALINDPVICYSNLAQPPIPSWLDNGASHTCTTAAQKRISPIKHKSRLSTLQATEFPQHTKEIYKYQ